jgi:outer membrane protein TolC
LRDVVFAYWDLANATEERAIRKASLAAAREQLEIVRATISAGKAAHSAAAEVEVAVALRTDEEIEARQNVLQRSLELRRLLGLEVRAGETDLAPADVASVSELALDLDTVLQLVREHNPEYARARAQGRLAAIDVDVTHNGLLPQLDLTASFGVNGYADTAETAYGQLANFKGYVAQAGFTFQEPLGRRAVRGAYEAAQATLHKARLTEADIAAQLSSAAATAVGRLATARDRAAALSQAVEVANLDLMAEKARFVAGRSTNFDVLRRQQEVADTRQRLLRAKIDFLRGLAAIEALTGEIFARHGFSFRASSARYQ